jgi:hypothetical protein
MQVAQRTLTRACQHALQDMQSWNRLVLVPCRSWCLIDHDDVNSAELQPRHSTVLPVALWTTTQLQYGVIPGRLAKLAAVLVQSWLALVREAAGE